MEKRWGNEKHGNKQADQQLIPVTKQICDSLYLFTFNISQILLLCEHQLHFFEFYNIVCLENRLFFLLIPIFIFLSICLMSS